MPSKRSTTCQYKFKQGIRKGKKCNRSCRGQFCCDHKPKKIKYLKNYREIAKDTKFKDKLSKLKVKDISKLNLTREQLKFKMYQDDLIVLYRELIGIREFLGMDQEKAKETMKKILYGKCNCICLVKEEQIPEDFLIGIKEEYENSKTKKNIVDYINKNYICSECKHVSFNWCKYCSPPPGRILSVEFNGNKQLALLKEKRLKKQMDKIKMKIQNQRQIINLVKERMNI